jgi:hypothetical protein
MQLTLVPPEEVGMHTAAENVHTEATHLAPQTVRRQLLEQHIELRRLLALGVVQALGVVDHRCAASGALRPLVKLIDELFTQHVADADAHARQRAELRALGAWPADGGDIELAARFDLLARDLLRDMAREERALLTGDGRSQGPG